MTDSPKRIHFIASGGSIMHSLAIALKQSGNNVSGSDDHFYEPSKSKLAAHGLLPENEGWDADRITEDIDFVVLGMHAKADNPELLRAQELGIQVYSFPEYIYEASKNKQRIVIAGSHGKTTITAMIMHVLKNIGKEFDYMVGAQLAGFENMVKISNAPIIIIEGDEYTTSPLDPTPKFLHYQHHIGLISGIAWDHFNVYPTIDDYVKQFELFADASSKAGTLVFCEEDNLASMIISQKDRADVINLPYRAHDHVVREGKTSLRLPDGELPLEVFGNHNMQNLSGALTLLKRLGVTEDQFYQAIFTFKGAAKRMEIIGENADTTIYLDFAHAPSKLKATNSAIKDQFPNRTLVSCVELHTYSSLNKDFIEQYENTFNHTDEALVYINPAAAERKGLESLTVEDLRSAFKRDDIILFNDQTNLFDHLTSHNWKDKNLAFMSSGNFGGLDFEALKTEIL